MLLGGQHATREQSWSQDLGASEKDQLLPLHPPLRTEAFHTGCQLAGHKWTVLALSTSFPFLVFTPPYPSPPGRLPKTLAFHPVSHLNILHCRNLVAVHFKSTLKFKHFKG